jgi:hypothetical protein
VIVKVGACYTSDAYAERRGGVAANEEIENHLKSLIAEQIYGEIASDLRLLIGKIYNSNIRHDDDAHELITSVNAIIKKTTP